LRSLLPPSCAAVLFLTLVAPAWALPALAPGVWTALPNTALWHVWWRDPVTARLLNDQSKGCGTPNGIVTAWNGAAYDSDRDWLIIPAAGGHCDYAGNEVYVFDLHAGVWRRDTDPTTSVIPQLGERPVTSSYSLPDGSQAPASRHIYNGAAYMPAPFSKVWLGGGSRWWDGAGAQDAWLYDVLGRQWAPASPAPSDIGDDGIVAAWDSVQQRVLYHTYSRLRVYDPAAPVTTPHWAVDDGRLPSTSEVRFYTGLFDPVRGRFVAAGPAGIYYYDVSGTPPYRLKRLALSGHQWPGPYAPGFAYDSGQDRYAVWGGGNTIYFVDPLSGVVTAETGSGPSVAAGQATGTYGRFQYSRTFNTFVLVTGPGDDVWVYQPLPTGAPAPPPPEPEPTPEPTPPTPSDPVPSVPIPPAPLPLPPAPSGPIEIPARTFVALGLPARDAGIPGLGMKHVTWTFHPPSGRLYATGGDYSGVGFQQSYRQETWSLSLAERWADRTNAAAGWRLEYPYCGPAGLVQPKHPDFVGWQWDPARGVFWMVPGTMVNSSDTCPGETTGPVSDPGFLFGHLMQFDPVSRTWTDAGADVGPDPSETWMSVLDPVKDRLVRLGWNGGFGGAVNVYEIGARRWSRAGLGVNAAGRDIHVSKEYLAADLEARVVYVIDGISGRLHRLGLDTLALEDLGPIPGGALGVENYAMAVWDSVNRVLLWLHPWEGQMHVYHPDTRSWEEVPVVTDVPGVAVQARAAAFDPVNNVAIFLGGVEPANPYVFLFRYAGR
jgi:hypothetical protein